MDPGEVKSAGQPGLNHRRLKRSTRRRLAAGEAERGGGHRESPTGDHLHDGEALRDEETRPRPVVLTAAALVA